MNKYQQSAAFISSVTSSNRKGRDFLPFRAALMVARLLEFQAQYNQAAPARHSAERSAHPHDSSAALGILHA